MVKLKLLVLLSLLGSLCGCGGAEEGANTALYGAGGCYNGDYNGNQGDSCGCDDDCSGRLGCSDGVCGGR